MRTRYLLWSHYDRKDIFAFVINFDSIIPFSILGEEDNGMYMDGASLIASNHNKIYVTHQELEKCRSKFNAWSYGEWLLRTTYFREHTLNVMTGRSTWQNILVSDSIG